MAITLSKSALVAPIFTATENPCSISSHPRPIICSPTTFSSPPVQTNFIKVFCFLSVRAWYIGVKTVEYTFTSSPL
uniref:Uncharacterized protein n=1 Tax=Lepeophtheirus salmonis TaxID=72036 RepID=A0A0K2U3B2_LEPSM